MERRAVQDVNQAKTAPLVCKDGPFKGYARLDWIHSAATRNKDGRSGSLFHHLNVTNLAQAFSELAPNKASGIDHVTKRSYQEQLEQNLQALADNIARGGWRPRPAREVLIPKPHGGTRPLAIGCLEDKIVQVLVARILEAIYEPLFHRHSYGFRRGKSAHQAIGRLYTVIDERRDNCVVVEMDIEKFFNSMDHDWLMQKLQVKIDDQHFLRLIRRMLRNSILSTDGKLTDNVKGTPQGSPASPALANICLHYLLDDWFSQNYAAKGELIRYADDAVFVFKTEQDASEFKAALATRMKEAGLNLNTDKSGIVTFHAKAAQGFVSFLGFAFYWGFKPGKARVLKLKTQPKKLHRSLQAFDEWIKTNRSRKRLKELLTTAAAKLRGHYNYFGVFFNEAKLNHFYHACTGALFRWLNRRSQRRSMKWEKFQRKGLRQLPRPPRGFELKNLRLEIGSGRKHKLKSRMPKLGTYGSVRSAGLKPAFT
jgi:RNA-directed DNA polymerase